MNISEMQSQISNDVFEQFCNLSIIPKDFFVNQMHFLFSRFFYKIYIGVIFI